MTLQRWKITIEYDGRPFCGWQIQNHDQKSIQEVIQKAIFKLSGEKRDIHGAGRTDAGVHARGQVAHFDLMREFEARNIILGLNNYLRKLPIAILKAEKVDADFHARFSAKSRSYRYQIIMRQARLTLDDGFFCHILKPLDFTPMQEAAKHFIGNHDLTSFRATHCQAKSPIKTITSLDLRQEENRIYLDITAPSFLHHQVRNIAGTLINVGKGKFSPDDIPKIIAAKDRCQAGPTASSDGLYFMNVEY